MANILTPKNLRIQVGCRGEQVLIKIGDTELPLLGWREAIRLANGWIREARLALAEQRITAVLQYAHHRLETYPKTLLDIAGWVLQKGYQARRRAGNYDLRYDP